MSEPIMSHSESIEINASPETVWSLVTDMERYGEWSSENTGGYWRKKDDGVPGTGEVGDEFVGINRRGDDEWKALVEITEREETQTFAFVTGGTALNFVHWRYDLEPNGEGTTLTESWALMNLSPLMVEHGDNEVQSRAANARESITATLNGMKAAAES
ncbi:MAG: SRPBCC family protein [Actinomycetota bacterium]|jgi:carbon monoxide dehydrogenase subunit G|nr:SRPBCC family protein [Actinomycetota bacterium]MEC9059449.1 SRPBCC family protein [Actinomycetota bacterium]MEC9473454.1 SRPBCC family protein [Actinomycetota bacterium]MED5361960.1 SRPBCC family protein [Actinomycetota bacterium]